MGLLKRHNKFDFGGKEKVINLNNHLVTVRLPKKNLTFEEGMKELKHQIDKIKRNSYSL